MPRLLGVGASTAGMMGVWGLVLAAGTEGAEGLPWRDGTADSSGSEAGGRDENLELQQQLQQQQQQDLATPSTGVSFTLGGDM